MTRHAHAERLAMADLMAEQGPAAPTLCGEWTVRDLAAHIILRERRPDAAGGIVLKRLAGYAERVQREIAAHDFPDLLRQLRNPPWWSPISNPLLDEQVNLAEMFVHHEDVRRAQPGWEPRDLSQDLQRELWTQARRRCALVLRRFRAVIHVEAPGFGAARGGAGGPDTLRLSGAPGELLIFLYGRQAHCHTIIDGPSALAEKLRRARLGI
ncbi:MAG TPA: TIGR03085 family protein [Micromonosporaceae bacterium]|nr:TIGR03085 family protein [Micromonosporaceae bacterium]